jgi:hypothetical protein
MSKVKSIVVTNRKNRPIKNIISAKFSNLMLPLTLRLIEINDKTQLVKNINIAHAVSSSITLAPLRSRMLLEVKTIKQSPKRFADVFSMCGDLSLFSFMVKKMLS